jgi:hypothetical protein
MPVATADPAIAHVGWTNSEDDRDRWLAVQIWLSRNDPPLHTAVQPRELPRALRSQVFDLTGDAPRDFLASDSHFDIVVVHNIWGSIETSLAASGGAAVSSRHSGVAWATRLTTAAARYVFLFGGDHCIGDLQRLEAWYSIISVPAQGTLCVLAARPWIGSAAATQPVSYNDMTQARWDSVRQLECNEALDLSYTDAHGKRLGRIEQMRNLKDLRLVGTPISNRDTAMIARCHGLRTLCLDETGISNGALMHLGRMTELECLSLNHTRIDGEGVRHLAELPHLQWLSMIGTGVGDDAVEDIGKHRYLTSLSIVGTRMTPAGLRRLRSLLPTCAIA